MCWAPEWYFYLCSLSGDSRLVTGKVWAVHASNHQTFSEQLMRALHTQPQGRGGNTHQLKTPIPAFFFSAPPTSRLLSLNTTQDLQVVWVDVGGDLQCRYVLGIWRQMCRQRKRNGVLHWKTDKSSEITCTLHDIDVRKGKKRCEHVPVSVFPGIGWEQPGA